jgi:hypothetical protein
MSTLFDVDEAAPLEHDVGVPVPSTQVEESPEGFVRREGSKRYAHFASLMPISNQAPDGGRVLDEFFMYMEISGWLGWYHAQNPEKSILPEVGSRLSNCDIDFSLSLYDTEFSSLVAARQLSTIFYNRQGNQSGASNLLPVAVFGEAFSSVSAVLSVLSSSYRIPQTPSDI